MVAKIIYEKSSTEILCELHAGNTRAHLEIRKTVAN